MDLTTKNIITGIITISLICCIIFLVIYFYKKKNDLNSDKDALELQIKEQSNQLTQTQLKYKELMNDKESILAQFKALTDQQQQAQNKVNSLEMEKKEIVNKLNDQTKLLAQTTNSEDKAALVDEIKKSQAIVEKITQEQKKAQASADTNATKLQEVQYQLDKLKSDSQNEINKQTEIIKQNTAELTEARNTVTKLDAQAKAAIDQLAQINTQADIANAKATKAFEDANAKIAKIQAESNAKIAQLTSQSQNSLNETSAKALADAQFQIKAIQAQTDVQINSIKTQLDAQTSAAAIANTKASQAQANADAKTSALDIATTQINTLKTQVQTAQASQSQLQTLQSQLQTQLYNQGISLQTAQQAQAQAEAKAKALQAEIQEKIAAAARPVDPSYCNIIQGIDTNLAITKKIFYYNTMYTNNNLNSCAKECYDDQECQFATYNYNTGECSLKQANASREYSYRYKVKNSNNTTKYGVVNGYDLPGATITTIGDNTNKIFSNSPDFPLYLKNKNFSADHCYASCSGYSNISPTGNYVPSNDFKIFYGLAPFDFAPRDLIQPSDNFKPTGLSKDPAVIPGTSTPVTPAYCYNKCKIDINKIQKLAYSVETDCMTECNVKPSCTHYSVTLQDPVDGGQKCIMKTFQPNDMYGGATIFLDKTNKTNSDKLNCISF